MKNKGRKHKWYSNPEESTGIGNSKSCIPHITRDIKSISSRGKFISRFDKKKWAKRIRGYFKSQTKELL